MRYLGNWYTPPEKKQEDRLQTTQRAIVRGGDRSPYPPRDVFVQSGPRGVLVTWKLPERKFTDISGWRVYKDNEQTLYAEIKDRGTRSHFIESTAATTSPVVNVFVASVSTFGQVSSAVQAQGSASNEPGAPTMPGPPPGYNNEGGGGGNQNTGSGRTGRELE